MSLGTSIIQETQDRQQKTGVGKEKEHVVCIEVDTCVLYSSSPHRSGKLGEFGA